MRTSRAGSIAWREGPEDLVFTGAKGAVLRLSHFRRSVFIPAVEATGLTGLTPDGLRHTAASLAIASGADVKVVQTMSDRKSATTTLDRYGHLYADRSTKSPIGWTRPALPVRPIRRRLFQDRPAFADERPVDQAPDFGRWA